MSIGHTRIWQALFALPRRMAQQIEVATVHEIEPGTHQADGAVTQIVRFPAGTGGNVFRAEEALCDGTICLTREATIERAKYQDKPSAAPWRKMSVRARPRATCHLPP